MRGQSEVGSYMIRPKTVRGNTFEPNPMKETALSHCRQHPMSR